MDKILRRLLIRAFHIENVKLEKKTQIKNNTLYIDSSVIEEIVSKEALISKIELNIVRPFETKINTNTIMDFIPISTKVLGSVGEGVTHTLTGVCCMLTGCDEDGRQMHEFGSSEGILKEHIVFGRAGTPKETDFIVHIDVRLKGGLPFDRELSTSAFRACDTFIQTIRESLKTNEAKEATEAHEFFDKFDLNKKKVALIKQVAGQGAMYDNQLFSKEPSGFAGGMSIINIQNVPIIISPNEYRDGAIRAMT